MPFPAIPAILGASTLVGGHLTRQTIISGARSGFSQFGQSLPFGAGYSLGTYLGFPGNYTNRNTYSKPNTYYLSMPYGRYSYRRYPRYGRRRYRRSYRSYRRYY